MAAVGFALAGALSCATGCASTANPSAGEANTEDPRLHVPSAEAAVAPSAPLARPWSTTTAEPIAPAEADWRRLWHEPGRGHDASPVAAHPDPVMTAESLHRSIDAPREALGFGDYGQMALAWLVWPAEPFWVDQE
ncbi:MAG: hypothetical protein AAF288_12340 [Planctomycetota bacterium]